MQTENTDFSETELYDESLFPTEETLEKLDPEISADDYTLEPVTVRFPHKTMVLLRELAQYNNRSVADIVRWGFGQELSEHLQSIRFIDIHQGKRIREEVLDLTNKLSDLEIELKRIGNNINQIAKILNSENTPSEEYLKAVQQLQINQQKLMDDYLAGISKVGDAICRILE